MPRPPPLPGKHKYSSNPYFASRALMKYLSIPIPVLVILKWSMQNPNVVYV